ncbi:tRNA-specific 2-thiouridylase MnmA [bioreactor metagenome]|uniref:tRNA-specific 2-thiouridylase MnmA n=1 Tax=bioreactor metagenome TaxID=1076179 RepID=A0A645I8B0_9ZZZZ
MIELNSCRNEVVVGAASDTLRRYLRAGDPNWLVPLPVAGTMVSAKVRSAGKSLPARVLETSESGFRLEFPDGVNAPARGQSAVLYDGGRVLGGGVIEEAWLNG